MTDAERAYWTVLAQILPVLGLALVLEARTLVQAYQQRAPSLSGFGGWIRRWQIGSMTLSGIAIAYGLLRALIALARGDAPGADETTLVQVAVSVAVVALLVNPLVTVAMASEIAWLGRALRWSPRTRLQRWQVLSGISRLHERVARLRSATGGDVRRMEASVAKFQSLFDAADAQGFQHPDISAARAHQDEGLALLDDARRRYRSLLVRELNLRGYRHEVRAVLDKLSLDRPTFEATGDPLLGFVTVREQSPRLAPDDGGFLGDPTSTRLPKMPEDDRLITDPADFYPDA